MIFTFKNVRLTVSLISVWTIAQTFVHIFWVIYGYLLSICWVQPMYYDVVFVYLTYFYKKSCGPIQLNNETLFLSRTAPKDFQDTGEIISNILYYFLRDALETAEWPLQSNALSRSEMYLGILFFADIAWIITAVFLLAGTFCKFKRKYFSIIFYGPWLLCTVFVVFLDVVASVHYGIDLIYIINYTSWLEFIGVQDISDFHHYNKHPSSSFIPAMPTTIVVCLLARIFVVWLLNVISFFLILFHAIPDLFQKTVIRSRPGSRRKLRYSSGEVDLTSSETRIRNWQLFYGSIEANSTMASNNPINNAETSSGAKYNRKVKGVVGFQELDNDNGSNDNRSYNRSVLDQKFNMLSTSSSASITLSDGEPNKSKISEL